MASDFDLLRERMVRNQLAARGIEDKRVLAAMSKVPREAFVPSHLKSSAYNDSPLTIGLGQTISQPYMVALMTAKLGLDSDSKVLEIGTGSGYQTAILAELAGQVYSIERIPELAESARLCLERFGYENVHIRTGDGTLGWEEEAPFHGIIVTAAPPETPPALTSQIALNGRLVIPVGRERYVQRLQIITRTPRGLDTANDIACVFVPLIGEQGWRESDL